MAYDINDIGRPVPGRKLKFNKGILGEQEDILGITGPSILPGATNQGGQYNWMKTASGTAASGTAVSSGTGAKRDIGADINKAASTLSPFVSNIVNSFRKPPVPKKGMPLSYTSLNKVNFSDERNKVSTMYQAAGRSAERNVDGNTAEAIKAFNRGDEISKLSSINERENNTNVAIGNQQAAMDAQVSAANTGMENKYRDELVERNVAGQREQSANWANAGDKAMMIRNENSKRNTELAKAGVLRTMYDKSGVLKRDNAIGQQWKASGIPDPFGEDYKWLDEKKKYGGVMKGLPKKVIC